MNLHSKQVNLNVLSSFVTLSGPFEIFVDDIFSSIMASVSRIVAGGVLDRYKASIR